MPSTKSRAYSFCQRNGGCTTTTSAPDPVRHLGRALELAPRLGAPDPLGEQQARGVHGADRDRVVLGELAHRRGLLAERVDAHHHLDRVVAQRRGVREAVRGRLGVDRGRWTARSRVTGPCSRAASCTLSWSMRSRMTPSRSAHGQISRAGGRRCPCRPRPRARRARSGGRGSPRRRAGRRARRRPSRPAWGSTPRSSPAPASRGTSGPVADGRGAADAGQRAERLRRGGGAVRGAGAQQVAGVAGDLGADLLADRLEVVVAGAPLGEVPRAPAAPPPAAATRRRRGARRRHRRSPASRRRCRRPPAGRPTTRTSGVRRGRSAAPRPHRRAPRCRRRCCSRTWSSTSSELTRRRARRRSRRTSMSSQPLSSATTSASAVNAGQRLDAGWATPRRRRRGARPGAAAACRRTPGAARRRRARRPPAGGRCWSRCPGRPGACRGHGYCVPGDRRLRACPKSTWSSRARSWSSSTRPTRPR